MLLKIDLFIPVNKVESVKPSYFVDPTEDPMNSPLTASLEDEPLRPVDEHLAQERPERSSNEGGIWGVSKPVGAWRCATCFANRNPQDAIICECCGDHRNDGQHPQPHPPSSPSPHRIGNVFPANSVGRGAITDNGFTFFADHGKDKKAPNSVGFPTESTFFAVGGGFNTEPLRRSARIKAKKAS